MHPDNFKYYEEMIGIHHKQKVEMILDSECNQSENSGFSMSQETVEKLNLAMKEANVWRCGKCSTINENRVNSCGACNSRLSGSK